MKIQITKGIGKGPTEAAAFDHALVNAGVANYNLIYLSSVIPPDSQIVQTSKPSVPKSDWGDRLYVVMAQKRTSRRNQEAWAGIGWILDQKTGKGLLQEHQGLNENEVRADLTTSLHALAENRGEKFTSPQMEVIGIKCEDQPVCALVVAVFESSSWHSRAANSSNSLIKRVANKIGKR